MGEVSPRRARLAARLRELRARRFPSGTAFARELGWVQPKVSRLETGVQLPSPEDLRLWVSHTDAEAEADALFDLLAAARVEYTAIADLLRAEGGLAGRQAQIAAMEAAATRIGEYQPALVPGLLQTAAYARAVLELGSARAKGASDEEIEGTVAGRIRRQAVLYEPGKRLQFVLGEAALWSAPGSAQVQAGQLDRLIAVAGLATVELGVVPLRAPMVVIPLSGFRVLDEELAFVESIVGTQRLDDPQEIEPAVNAFETLRAAAVTGTDALALIRRAAEAIDV